MNDIFSLIYQELYIYLTKFKCTIRDVFLHFVKNQQKLSNSDKKSEKKVQRPRISQFVCVRDTQKGIFV